MFCQSESLLIEGVDAARVVSLRRIGAIFSLHISHGIMKYLGSTRGVLTREAVVARSQTRTKLTRDPEVSGDCTLLAFVFRVVSFEEAKC